LRAQNAQKYVCVWGGSLQRSPDHLAGPFSGSKEWGREGDEKEGEGKEEERREGLRSAPGQIPGCAYVKTVSLRCFGED